MFQRFRTRVKIRIVSHVTVMDELLQAFTDHLRGERRVSPHTLRNYLSDLGQFRQFLAKRKLCLDGDAVDARKVDI
ncbi:MAG: site-specific integrase, partial [Candidatus Binatia bacterium]